MYIYVYIFYTDLDLSFRRCARAVLIFTCVEERAVLIFFREDATSLVLYISVAVSLYLFSLHISIYLSIY